MERYRKISVRIWNDEKFRALSDDGKLLFLFILTNPNMTSIGAMRASVESLAGELRWTVERVSATLSEGFREPSSNGSRMVVEGFREGLNNLVEFDTNSCCLCVPNFLKYNRPENPNVVKGWENILDLIPECELQRVHMTRICAFIDEIGENYAKALPEPFRKGIGNPSGMVAEIRKQKAESREQKAEREKKADTAPLSCAEPETTQAHAPQTQSVNEKTILEFAVTGNPNSPSWPLTQGIVDKLKAAFPTVDVLAECRKALCWIEMNPTRKKTARGMPKFLNGWISRSQNSGYTAKGINGQNNGRKDTTAYFSPEYSVEVDAAIAASKANTITADAYLAEQARKRVQAGTDPEVPI